MPRGKRTIRPDLRPVTSRLTHRRGPRPRPNEVAHSLERRRARTSARPPVYMDRSLSPEDIDIFMASSKYSWDQSSEYEIRYFKSRVQSPILRTLTQAGR